jgi:hypothetical protein
MPATPSIDGWPGMTYDVNQFWPGNSGKFFASFQIQNVTWQLVQYAG